ncbi:hypothetical protein DY000_02014721 [Brassica cretica]|uniref:Uncharacterized protein n=1 Tax=Brassica cretica TaxID=69181 RepID=A0ABQ7D926_BRACR|nr:hypothetical protein DY000_02014721 [Brassica cretica]
MDGACYGLREISFKGLARMHGLVSYRCSEELRLGRYVATERDEHLVATQPGADDICEFKAGADLLDIFRRKEETLSGVASSPPFFLGSPPCRTSNPLARDAQFGDSKLNLVSPSLSPLIPSPSRVKGGGCG